MHLQVHATRTHTAVAAACRPLMGTSDAQGETRKSVWCDGPELSLDLIAHPFETVNQCAEGVLADAAARAGRFLQEPVGIGVAFAAQHRLDGFGNHRPVNYVAGWWGRACELKCVCGRRVAAQ